MVYKENIIESLRISAASLPLFVVKVNEDRSVLTNHNHFSNKMISKASKRRLKSLLYDAR